MTPENCDSRLTEITTRWSLLHAAHVEDRNDPEQTRSLLLMRYIGAVYRYLRAAVGDPLLADDLTQEFALGFLKGKFHKADPSRGRFRDYLKTSLFHLVHDHFRNTHRERAAKLESDPTDPRDYFRETETLFLQSWRAELLAKAWAKLAEDEQHTGQPYHTVLKLRVDHSQTASSELAGLLSETLDRPMSAENYRQLLHRARERFARALLSEISSTIPDPTKENVAQELAELNLLAYCQAYLKP